jgi:hypothetical protein
MMSSWAVETSRSTADWARIYMHAVAYSFALFPICRPQLFTFSPILVGNLPDKIKCDHVGKSDQMFNDVDGGIYQPSRQC